MDIVTYAGELGPACSFELDHELADLTTAVRPVVTVDLSAATRIHPAVLSVVIRHQRQARRQGGELHLIAPLEPAARHTLDQVGLITVMAVA
jgi:anti-anti-sigma regulatory factor